MTFRKTLAASAVLSLYGTAQAALFDRGNGMVYDSSQDITWLADMNLAKTSGHDSDGLMTWDAAQQWAAQLSHGGHDDWRLPTLDPDDGTCSSPPGYGYHCTGGELSHLMVADLGNQPGQPVLNTELNSAEQNANLALFSHLRAYAYWSSVEYVSNPNQVWAFSSLDGYQMRGLKDTSLFAVAVRDGDVAAVPEPQAPALWLAGLGLLAALARRRRA